MAVERRRVVIDASLALSFVMPGQPYHAQAAALLRAWAVEGAVLVAPPLFESEADGVIRRYVRRGLVDMEAGVAAQELLDALAVVVIQDVRVRGRAREIAVKFNQDGVYDATYAALAEVLGCEYWTADRAFYRAVKEGLDYVRFAGEAGAPQG